ncbi:MAG TPA: PEP-CTERM sorting domain-containing protein [Pirellulales bacterium]|nr:PEP-CTERM sorting domain-containing protein [Pirellulales bacterium]
MCAVFLACAAHAQAAIIVTVGSSLVTPGGPVDYLPVYINTDSGTVDLAATSFEFQITTNGSTAVQFVNSPAPSVDPTFNNLNYVFFGASGDKAFANPLGTASTTTTFAGGDEANNTNFFVPLSTTPELLAMLPVTTLTNSAPPLGDTFSVSLVPYNSVSNPSTFFTDINADSISISAGSFNPTPVTVTPEPSTFTLTALGLVALAGAARRRRKAGRV